MIDKEKAIKLQKKLEQRKLSIQEALQEQIVLQWLKTNNPAFQSMLTPQATIQIIDLLIIPGPPNDKIRSYKIPMIAADLLSTMIPRVYELLFNEDPEEKGSPVLKRLLKYFDTAPNYVISGYVARIILNLFPANPSRVLEFILRSNPQKMLNYVESQSIAQLLTRIIIVQDTLLNAQIKERVALFGEIVSQYIENKRSEEELSSINWILSESITRLWTQKHKQLGRFSSTLFRLVEAIIDHNDLYQQESMMIAVCKQVSVYQKEAPFLIAALYKKIYQQLSLGRIDSSNSNRPKLASKRYKYLQSVHYIIAHGSEAISKQLPTNYINRYQWHSLALIEIEKIMKAAFNSNTDAIFIALNRSYLSDKMKQFARIQGESKNSCGFSGLLTNLAVSLKQCLEKQVGYGAWLKKSQAEGGLDNWLNDFLGKKKQIQENEIKVVNQIAKPFYSVSKLTVLFKQFFDDTEAINARMQTQSPSKHQKEEREMLEEIEKENELVYKLMSQVTNQVLPEDKKGQETCQ